MRKVIFTLAALGAAVVMPMSAAIAQPVDNSILTVTGERTDTALTAYQARVASAPGDEMAWLNIAILQAHAGRANEAQQAIAHVMALDNAVVQNQFGDDVWSHNWAQNVAPRVTQISLR